MASVLVVGCGIVGPVIALLLKKKGYRPVIAERVTEMRDVGLSHSLYPNGLKVLDTIGLARDFGGIPLRKIIECNSEEAFLGEMDFTSLIDRYGFSPIGVRRFVLQQRLRDSAVRQDVPVFQGWELNHVRETQDAVVAVAKDKREIAASFVIGCDGIHSATRRLVLQKHGRSELAADHTGQVAIGGRCPTPKDIVHGLGRGWYGDGKYVGSYEVDDKTSVWGLALPSPPEKENWLQADDLEEQKSQLLKDFAGWTDSVRQLIATTEKLVKVGLYDRPELPPGQWFYGRCVLVGDAAHPTSPHLGQGANQGLEDCWHLSQMLPDASGDLSTQKLEEAFLRYAEKRQPRTSELVKAARKQGEMRVVHGKEACKTRDEKVKEIWTNKTAVEAKMHELYKEPFEC